MPRTPTRKNSSANNSSTNLQTITSTPTKNSTEENAERERRGSVTERERRASITERRASIAGERDRRGSVTERRMSFVEEEERINNLNGTEFEWNLLDRLVGTGMAVPDLPSMFSNYKYPSLNSRIFEFSNLEFLNCELFSLIVSSYSGRASVLIVPDTLREPILIGRKNITKPV